MSSTCTCVQSRSVCKYVRGGLITVEKYNLNDCGVIVEIDPPSEIGSFAMLAAFAESTDEVPIVYLTTPPFWQAFQPSVQNPPVGIWGHMGPMHEVWLSE